ncbi:adenylyl cyclase X E-like isoform X2 [Drosophila montana]|uniref:adenylyl cyclase X E-like isoform X2 n=1 Tax=Drosophila montana TaxID=40370 RepID=UPI00313CE4AA
MKCQFDYSKEVRWERNFLKKKCKEIGVEKEFTEYQMRLSANYVGVFLLLHLAFTFICLRTQDRDKIYIDVGFYTVSAAVVTLILWPNANPSCVPKLRCKLYLPSVLAVVFMVFSDLSLNLYHYYMDDWIIGSFFDTYILFTIYMFLPIPYILPPLALGISVSVLYTSYFVIYLASKHRYEMANVTHFNYMSVELSHQFCLNLYGTFFRIMREIIVRSSFLDRQQYVMQDIWLRSARAQEKLFLHSILPPQIAQPIQEDIRNRIKFSEKHRNTPLNTRRDRIMAIQIHPDVSILYADIVNYTYLTTTLTVKKLVALLHELYARFDMAASRYTVQRIKFLGDCYYCVAGLTRPDPDHARCCLDFGLCMIDNIREVRAKEKLEIDIRVGVHSGALCAGVLGAAKLQYDIWGSDVVIANRLEGTGVPGHIHTSERTLQMVIEPTYTVQPGTEKARNDPFLQKHNVVTYLIPPNVKPRAVIDLDFVSVRIIDSETELEQQSSVGLELREEFQKMPVGPVSLRENFKEIFNLWGKNRHKEYIRTRPVIGIYLLHFRDPRLEYGYMHQPDYMLKYSILLAWVFGLTLSYIQYAHDTGMVKLGIIVDGVVILSLSILLFLTWYKKLCFLRYSTQDHKYSRISCCLFRVAESIQRSLIKRIGIYMYTIIAYFGIISVMLMDCDREEYEVVHIESKLYHYEPDMNMCFHPWMLTNMMCLIIGMSLIFTRIPFMMKVVVSALEALTYMIILFFQYGYIVHHSLTTNPYFEAEYAHCLLVIITLLSLYFKERQTEFNNKINYKWREELLKKQHDALIADQSITILLHNILPAHVANVYLTSLARHELYYEDYAMVAVMFASLHNFELDLPNLRVLNEIISEFDRILSYYRDDYLVEKIKIVGCTYMAACGLDLRFSSVISQERTTHESVIQEVLRARRSISVFRKDKFASSEKKEEVVFVLTTFALDLMRTLWTCNNDYKNLPVDRDVFSADMSIGISSGEVMAGVVGASQVHYDIWGNAVNMASRMDSTGLAGQIQVTEETAEMLRKYGLECNYRGMTFVKGRGILPTYFVGIDENYEFKYIYESRHQDSDDSKSKQTSSEKDA